MRSVSSTRGALDALYAIPVKGDPFTRQGDALDLMAVSPDGQFVLVLSAIDDPEPGTPVVSVIDLTARKTVRRVRMARKPAGLAFAVDNPVYTERLTVEEALIELGYLSPEDVLEMIVRLETGEPLSADVIAQVEPPTGLAAFAGGSGGPGFWRRNDVAPAASLDLPEAVEPLIAEIVQRFLVENHLGEVGPELVQRIYPQLQQPRALQSWFGRRLTRAARQLHTVFIEVNEVTDKTENALKIAGDVYTARLFSLVAARLGLDDWKASVREKLKTLDDIYRFAVDQTSMARGELLELTIVLILVLELVLFFLGIMR